MKTIPLLRHMLSVVLFLPFFVRAESGLSRLAAFSIGEEGGPLVSNVPLNEINVRAYRFFHKEWAAIYDEVWFKTDKEFIVVFPANAHRKKAFFNLRGIFLYSLEYYTGKDISPALEGLVKNKYPDYHIKVVTEVSTIDKTSYFISIENNDFVRTLSVIDGKIEVLEELINGDSETSKTRN